MEFKDIKTGMKVKLLGKHGCGDNYNNINDWYEVLDDMDNIEILETQGYGYVVEIESDNCIWVDECKNGKGWWFIASDLEPYEEITEQNTNESVTQKTPKEWLLTPKAIFTTRRGIEWFVLGNGMAIRIADGKVFNDTLDHDYTEILEWYNDCPANDIMKITYEGEVVWKRKEYMTLTDAIKTGKSIKHNTWLEFVSPKQALITISNDVCLINLFSDKVWEVE